MFEKSLNWKLHEKKRINKKIGTDRMYINPSWKKTRLVSKPKNKDISARSSS